jgi:WD40 repeat protein
MQKSPFKFLDSFTKDDRDIFFGREKETEELHAKILESRLLLVYGTSGTGKSSLINCGLANKFNDSDWLPVNIRRGTDINRNLFEALAKTAITKTPFEKVLSSESRKYSLEKLLRSVWLDHFKPVFLIFDQFEELFIFGSKDEKEELIRNVAKVISSDIQCRFIFAMREEYLAGVTEFEKEIPTFLSNRIRIEKMTRQNAIRTIEGPCRINDIKVEAGMAEAVLEKLNPDSPEVELTWLQIYLDRIMRHAEDEHHNVHELAMDLLEKAGEVKDVLATFLEEQISELSDPETGLVILKSFVSTKGTRQQITEEEVIEYTQTFGKSISGDTIKELIQKFIKLRILKDKDEDGRYELRHDSLASKIYEKITIVEKELLEIKSFLENAYANYEKRGLLLTEEDLNYIAPYEDRLFLNEKNLRFIEDSKLAFHRARRRRLNFAIAVVSVIIVILSFFTVWAIKERGNAIRQQSIAENQKNAAVKAKDDADAARKEADASRQKAVENEKLAVAARNQSEIDRRNALTAKEEALREKSRAEAMSAVASEQAKKAEEEKIIAEQQRSLALSAGEKAKRLGLLSTAQNLALKSLALDKDPQLMGLLAVQAYSFNLKNGGAVNDPVIYRALDKAYCTLDNSRNSLYQGVPGEAVSLAWNRPSIVSADLNGTVIQWNGQGSFSPIPGLPGSSFIDIISLSPDGNKIITGFENGRLEVNAISAKNSAGELIDGNKGSVRTTAWSRDGRFFATGGNDSIIKVWDLGSGPASLIHSFKSLGKVISLCLCSGDSVISASSDGSISLWNANSSEPKTLFERGNELPVCIAWNRIERKILAGCSDGTLLLIDPENPAVKPGSFEVSSTGIHYIVLSDDCSLMATASWDKTIRLYNYHEFFEQLNMIGGSVSLNYPDAMTRSLIFTGGNRLVAGLSDKKIRIWETSREKLVNEICKLLNRQMTRQEWTENVGSEIPYDSTCK